MININLYNLDDKLLLVHQNRCIIPLNLDGTVPHNLVHGLTFIDSGINKPNLRDVISLFNLKNFPLNDTRGK